jgi:hypothetical protein
MTNLVEEFFKRNLTEAEARSLEELLEKSPEEAQRFAENFRQEYLAMGLPAPVIPKHIGLPAPVGGLSLAKVFLLAAVLGGAGSLAFWLWPHPTVKPANLALSTLPEKKQVLSRPVLPPPPVVLPEKLDGSFAEGNRLSVVVELEKTAPVQVRILGLKNEAVRTLYTGNLAPGKWAIHWDGLLSNGSKAPAGRYQIQVKSGASQMFKTVSIQ